MFHSFARSKLQLIAVERILPLHFKLARPHIRTLTRSMPSKKDDKYTDPELREEVKEEIQAGDKGGKPGQWSARKVCAIIVVNGTTFEQVLEYVV